MCASRIVFVVTGSISAYKACDAISQLVQHGHKVRTVATAAALNFVGAATLEGLTGEPVRTDLFAAGGALDHIELDRWADVLVICPATAHTINRLAAGLADDLTGSLFLAHDWRKPCLVAPAMNPAMWEHPATKASVATLASWGVRFLPVGEGRTACGEIGEGRLAEPRTIVAEIEAALAKPARPWNILVTSGGTSEPIDGVRVLSNTSTGQTGAAIAGYFVRRGHRVTLLRAQNAVACPQAKELRFQSFADLDEALARLLGEQAFDVVIHAAAVGDFAVGSVSVNGQVFAAGQGKLDTTQEATLRLRPHPKLVDTLRARSRAKAVRIVAFKLTHGADRAASERAVAALFAHSGADFVVHNDLAARAATGEFPADIYPAGGGAPLHCPSRAALPAGLEQALAALVSPVLS